MADLSIYQLNNAVATIIITVRNGKANALNDQVFEALNRADEDKMAVILAGQPSIF
tara:strand:- start:62 stop:229 length:168 start_codon:yes stop_codon:yes gene_type:complete